MALWKITDGGPKAVAEAKFRKENLLESDLEDWVVSNPQILGEELLVIGRQVLIPDIKDRLDVLAVDTAGNTVIIELKRGKLKDPVDIQAMRYASYVSRWRFEDFERQARNFMGKTGDADFNFNETYEEFCQEAGVDETPELNTDQRIIVVGSGVRERLGSVALWLREHRVDIKVIEVRAYKEGGDLLIEPTVIVPLPVSRFADIGKTKGEGKPWVVDGRGWHLDHRCSPTTQAMLLKLDDIIQDNFDVEGPVWNQKHYVAYKVSNYNRFIVVTSSKMIRLEFLIAKDSLSTEKVAELLGVQQLALEDSLSEKLNLPSSVAVRNRNEQTDRLHLRVKEDFDLSGEEFVKFLKLAYDAWPK